MWAGILGCSASAHAGEVAHTAQGHAQSPVWSPDGKFLAYEVNYFGLWSYLVVVSPMGGSIAGSALKVKMPGSSGPFSSNQSMVNSTWHPQGYLIFSGSNEEGKYRVYMTQPPNVAAIELLAKTQAPGDLSFPAVSADATMVAFVSDQTGDGDVQIYQSTTGKVVQATSSGGAEVYPTFSSDGQSVFYNRKVNMQLDIYTTNLATKEAKILVKGSGDQTRPVGKNEIWSSFPLQTAKARGILWLLTAMAVISGCSPLEFDYRIRHGLLCHQMGIGWPSVTITPPKPIVCI